MPPSRNCLFLLLLFLGISSHLAAQDTGCLHRTITLSVFNSRGSLMRGFGPSDFEGRLGGKAVKILSVKPDERPHRIAVLLDTSGAVLGQPDAQAWVTANTIASHITRSTLQNTSLALLLFSDKVNEQVGFSQGAPVAAKRLAEIRDNVEYAKAYLRGKSAPRDAILAAMNLFKDAGYSDAIYVVGDGADNQSRNGAGAVRDALVSKGIRLYVSMLSFGSVGGMSDWDRRSQESDPIEISDLSSASGGLVFGRLGAGFFRKTIYNVKAQEADAAKNILASLYMSMTLNDLVELELPEPGGDRVKWSLEFSGVQKKAHPDWLLVYPHELAPCRGRAPAKANSPKAN
jgi:hypothetical protein